MEITSDMVLVELAELLIVCWIRAQVNVKNNCKYCNIYTRGLDQRLVKIIYTFGTKIIGFNNKMMDPTIIKVGK